MPLLMLITAATSAVAQDETAGTKADRKRAKIDRTTQDTLARLFSEDPDARGLMDTAYGYAVFSNIKIVFGLSAGGGGGVAVEKSTGERTYMKMGTAGIGIGLGGQRYHVVFLFEDEATFGHFILEGWQGDAAANAVAGTEGKNVKTSFSRGMAVYQLTGSGLMLKADVAGTKYWVNKRLNPR